MTNLIKNLENKVKKYSYRGLDWVTRMTGPVTFPDQRTIVMPNFYSENGYSSEGVCNELMIQAFFDLIKKESSVYDEGKLYRVKGGDPVFFSLPAAIVRDQNGRIIQELPKRSRGTHLFLALTDRRIADNEQVLQGDYARQALLDGNAILFDPSFGIVEPFKDSEYLVDEIWSPGYKSSHISGSAVFSNGHYNSTQQIIGISGGLVVSFNAYFPEPDTSKGYAITISFMTPGIETNYDVSIYNRSLDYTAKHLEGLDVFLEHMRKVCQRSVLGDDLSKYQTGITVW